MLNRKIAVGFIVGFFMSGCGEKKALDTKAISCLNFVQGFYDWYVPIAFNGRSTPAYSIAIGKKGDIFSPELKSQLQANSKIYAGQGDSIKSLDFDPFLFSQDPWPEYKATGAVLAGEKCYVSVGAVSSGKVSEISNLRAVSEKRNEKWVFVDFIYMGSGQGKDTNLSELLSEIVGSESKRHK